MTSVGFMRMEKLKGAGIILLAARHNRREIAAELGAGGSIDASRSALNVKLVGPGSAREVADRARQLMRGVGIDKLRKNAVPAIEFLFSLPAGLVADPVAYFRDCVAWVAGRFGGESNILSADVHFDEAQPHCHVLLLPLRDGSLQGSDMYGGPRELEGHQRSFYEVVASTHGLRRAPARLTGGQRQKLAQAVLRRLSATQDPAQQSAAWQVIRDAIAHDPRPFAASLGIELEAPPTKAPRSFAAIMTSPGKGAKTHAEADRRDAELMARPKASPASPIGFGAQVEDESLSCVGVGPAPAEQITSARQGEPGEVSRHVGDDSDERKVSKAAPSDEVGADSAHETTLPTGRLTFDSTTQRRAATAPARLVGTPSGIDQVESRIQEAIQPCLDAAKPQD